MGMPTSSKMPGFAEWAQIGPGRLWGDRSFRRLPRADGFLTRSATACRHVVNAYGGRAMQPRDGKHQYRVATEPSAWAGAGRSKSQAGLPRLTGRTAGRTGSVRSKTETEGETETASKILTSSGEFAGSDAAMAPADGRARLVAELRQAVHARDEFIAIAAHELRNPMTPILGYAEHILSGCRRRESACPDAIIVALERLAGLIAEYVKRATTLLDVSRITAGKLRAELSAVDLSAMMRQAVARHRSPAERSGCRLQPNIEDGVSGLLDQLAVEQIADNLLSNAVKYGAGEPIEIALVRHGAAAQLTVKDHGIGISAEDQARIFAAFERAVTRREQGGFGIGLWLVRQLVDSMHGEIRVTSRPADGSAFTVTLPLSPP
jgi:signal transduction histidine kinase